MSKVFNHSSLRVERAKKATCPRCRGAGGVFPRDKDGPCTVCGGDGEVWLSVEGTGWLRRIGARLENSDIL